MSIGGSQYRDASVWVDGRRGFRIVQVIASLDGSAAGPSYSVPRLCEALSEYGHSVSLLSGTSQRLQRCSDEAGFEDCRYPFQHASLPLLGKLGIAPGLRESLLLKSAEADIFHSHGLWRLPNIYPSAAARLTGKPLVLSPRGMLAPSALKFSKLSKQLFWAVKQRSEVRAVSAFHATSEQECADIRAQGLNQPIAIIPNGIDVPELELAQRSGPKAPTVVFLGRLHPVKAIDRLISAWHLLGKETDGWQLLIVGPVESDYDRELKTLIAELQLKNVALQGPISGEEKWRLLSDAEVTILPSLSENFGVSVAESLAVGTPVIASRGTPWQGLETNACGWWVDNDPESLAVALVNALRLSATQRKAMGLRGRKWMESDFSWAGVAKNMLEFYDWLRGECDVPWFVKIE